MKENLYDWDIWWENEMMSIIHDYGHNDKFLQYV